MSSISGVKCIATNANLTISETYQSFAVAHLLPDRRLSLLHYVSPSPAVINLPSWCLDLSRLTPDRKFGDNLSEFRAGIPRPRHRPTGIRVRRLSRIFPYRMKQQWPRTTTRYLQAFKILLGKGIIVDGIARIVSDDPSWDFSSPKIVQIAVWDQECLELSQTTLRCPNAIQDTYVRTLTANTDINEDTIPRQILPKGFDASYVSAREILKTGNYRILDAQPLAAGTLYLRATRRTCRLRRCFSTTGDRIGLCPPHSKQDDLICILWGARSPFVLRPVRNTNNFQLIGECYVDGLMYGEAFQIKNKEQLKDMVFPLI